MNQLYHAAVIVNAIISLAFFFAASFSSSNVGPIAIIVTLILAITAVFICYRAYEESRRGNVMRAVVTMSEAVIKTLCKRIQGERMTQAEFDFSEAILNSSHLLSDIKITEKKQ